MLMTYKLFAKNKDNLKLSQVFSNDINIIFGLDKCKTCTVMKGKLQERIHIRRRRKYGITGTRRPQMKEIKAKFIKRTKNILKTQLNGRNTATIINTLSYSFGVGSTQ